MWYFNDFNEVMDISKAIGFYWQGERFNADTQKASYFSVYALFSVSSVNYKCFDNPMTPFEFKLKRFKTEDDAKKFVADLVAKLNAEKNKTEDVAKKFVADLAAKLNAEKK